MHQVFPYKILYDLEIIVNYLYIDFTPLYTILIFKSTKHKSTDL